MSFEDGVEGRSPRATSPVIRPSPLHSPPSRPRYQGSRKISTEDLPEGIKSSVDEVREYLRDASNEVRANFDLLVARSQGKPGGTPDVPRGEDGRFSAGRPDDEGDSGIPNIVRDTGTLSEAPPPRDRTREPKAGNSVEYTVRRLERESQDDPEVAAINARFRAGDITANAAAVLAGFRPRSITLPVVPRMAARLPARHFSREQFAELVACVDAEYDRNGEVAP